MNTSNISNVEMNSNEAQQVEGTVVECANFAQLALESPELQAAAIGSKLDELFAHLEPPASEMEKGYRLHLFEVKNGYKRSRYAFGEALYTYWFWCIDTKQSKKSAQNSARRATFEGLCDLIGVERRTAYNIMDDYKRAKNVHSDFRAVAESLNIDLAERRHADLVSHLTAHPDLRHSQNVQDQAAAVFAKAQENVAVAKQEREEKTRLAQAAEAQKSKYTKLLEFVAELYEGAAVPEFRKDMEQVTKYLTSYLREGDTVPKLEDAHDKNRAKAA